MYIDISSVVNFSVTKPSIDLTKEDVLSLAEDRFVKIF